MSCAISESRSRSARPVLRPPAVPSRASLRTSTRRCPIRSLSLGATETGSADVSPRSPTPAEPFLGALKGATARAEALRRVAAQRDCGSILRSPTCIETWECESEDWGGGYSSRRGYRRSRWGYAPEDDAEDSDSAQDDADQHTLLSLIRQRDRAQSLHQRAGEAGPQREASPASGEVCLTRASRELKSSSPACEGWMGNYGKHGGSLAPTTARPS